MFGKAHRHPDPRRCSSSAWPSGWPAALAQRAHGLARPGAEPGGHAGDALHLPRHRHPDRRRQRGHRRRRCRTASSRSPRASVLGDARTWRSRSPWSSASVPTTCGRSGPAASCTRSARTPRPPGWPASRSAGGLHGVRHQRRARRARRRAVGGRSTRPSTPPPAPATSSGDRRGRGRRRRDLRRQRHGVGAASARCCSPRIDLGAARARHLAVLAARPSPVSCCWSRSASTGSIAVRLLAALRRRSPRWLD